MAHKIEIVEESRVGNIGSAYCEPMNNFSNISKEKEALKGLVSKGKSAGLVFGKPK